MPSTALSTGDMPRGPSYLGRPSFRHVFAESTVLQHLSYLGRPSFRQVSNKNTPAFTFPHLSAVNTPTSIFPYVSAENTPACTFPHVSAENTPTCTFPHVSAENTVLQHRPLLTPSFLMRLIHYLSLRSTNKLLTEFIVS